MIHGILNKVRGKRVYSREVSSLIGNILSDPEARRLEFRAATILSMPVQMAVKTGTSAIKLQGALADDPVDWIVDGQLLQSTHGNQYLWSMQPGKRWLTVRLWRQGKLVFQNSGVNVVVK